MISLRLNNFIVLFTLVTFSLMTVTQGGLFGGILDIPKDIVGAADTVESVANPAPAPAPTTSNTPSPTPIPTTNAKSSPKSAAAGSDNLSDSLGQRNVEINLSLMGVCYVLGLVGAMGLFVL
ncbi:hypothetical protein NHQ30_004280 [Ciborinia camelliae]|nr:hypothetical protein NHQ30_004280 [Ciborinia camelliae]